MVPTLLTRSHSSWILVTIERKTAVHFAVDFVSLLLVDLSIVLRKAFSAELLILLVLCRSSTPRQNPTPLHMHLRAYGGYRCIFTISVDSV